MLRKTKKKITRLKQGQTRVIISGFGREMASNI